MFRRGKGNGLANTSRLMKFPRNFLHVGLEGSYWSGQARPGQARPGQAANLSPPGDKFVGGVLGCPVQRLLVLLRQ